VRGAMVFGEIDIISGYRKTDKGGSYNFNSIYGKGLVNAHIKAEKMNLASCVIDNSIIERIKDFGNIENLIGDYAMKYRVPYKNEVVYDSEFLLKFYTGKTINQEAFTNRAKGIADAFQGDNKGMNDHSKILLENTIEFLAVMRE
jgi:hypothetical protein